MTRLPRLIIAEDHQMVAEMLRQVLPPAFRIIGVAGTGDALMQLLQRATPDCILLDLSLPGRSGLDVLPELHRQYPTLPVLVVTMHADRAIASAAFAAGALGFVPKDSGVQELKLAIREVLAGRQYLSPKVAPHAQHLGLAAVHPGLSQLSPRQQEIVLLIAKGTTSAEIARLLGVSASTIAFHRLNIRQRLGITSDSGLLRYAVLVAAML
jgi:DNA-binding NarL/FixJ family response regulator